MGRWLRIVFCGGFALVVLMLAARVNPMTAARGILMTAARADSLLVDTWSPPFDYRNPAQPRNYRLLDRAARAWRFCVSYPHLKDPYWLSVNHGMAGEARRLGVAMRVVEAGGYPRLDRQINQVRACVAAGADALIVGTISYDGLTPAIQDIADPGIAAKVGVSWTDMGAKTGAFLAARHPDPAHGVRITVLPGPEKADWVGFMLDGFRAAIKGSGVEVVVVKNGDTGKEIQRTLVEEVLEEAPDIDYIVGTAVSAEAAIGLLRDWRGPNKPEILSFYLTHGVYRGIKRGKILAAPTDRPVLQGRLSIELAVRVLEDKADFRHIGPAITLVNQKNLPRIDVERSLAPASFVPIFDIP